MPLCFPWEVHPAHRDLPLQEKGNTPLHVAARAGQVSQAELLTVYGADPGAPDSNGKTPIDYARSVLHMDAISLINPNPMNLCSLKCGALLFPNFAGRRDTMIWQIVWWRFSTSSLIDWRSTCVGEDQVSRELTVLLSKSARKAAVLHPGKTYTIQPLEGVFFFLFIQEEGCLYSFNAFLALADTVPSNTIYWDDT